MRLNNGVTMPEIGIGTYMLTPDEAYESVLAALKCGYRMIDTAAVYVNERAVGRAIKDSGVPRKDIFLSTKIWPSEFKNDDAVDESLQRLGVDYVDLMFLHQPCSGYKYAYANLEKAYRAGKIKSLGLSNFEGKYFEDVMKNCDIAPQVVQVEAHPYYPQTKFRSVIKDSEIKLMSWYPLGHGDSGLLGEKVLTEIAEKHACSVAQVCLRWQIQMGFAVIPGSKNAEHIAENLKVLDLSLDAEDMAKIATLSADKRFFHRTPVQLAAFSVWQPKYEPDPDGPDKKTLKATAKAEKEEQKAELKKAEKEEKKAEKEEKKESKKAERDAAKANRENKKILKAAAKADKEGKRIEKSNAKLEKEAKKAEKKEKKKNKSKEN